MSENKTMRLNKVLRELNISLDRAVEHLASKGHEIESRPTTKISSDEYEVLLDGFQTDRSKKAESKEVGEEKAFEEFTNLKGKFVDGEFYLFIVDFEGLTLAHGGNPKLKGKNMLELKDPSGKYFIKDFIKLAKTKGNGWVNYKWSNPETKKIGKKSTFIKVIKGKNYFIGCGIYLKK